MMDRTGYADASHMGLGHGRRALALSGWMLLIFLTSFPHLATAQTIITSDILVPTVWSSDVVLTDPIFVANSATLTILPGVTVRAEPATFATDLPGALVITEGSQLFADGTAADPIFFASAAVDANGDGIPDDNDNDGYPDPYTLGSPFLDAQPSAGPPPDILAETWWGLFVLGDAPIDYTCPGLVEGRLDFLDIQGNPFEWAGFGGTTPGDDSGIIRYVSVRSADVPVGADPADCCDGIRIANGITLGGVGDATTFEFNDFVSVCWRGFADLHAHPLNHLGFGHRAAGTTCSQPEGLFHGFPGGAFDPLVPEAGMLTDLLACSSEDHSHCIPSTLPQYLTRIEMLQLIEQSFPDHGPTGAPDLAYWPHSQSRTHQQMHVKWMHEAYTAGQRVMIASVTDNEVLEKWYHYADLGPTCNVFPHDVAFAKQAALKQIAAIQQLVADNPTWLHLADTPEDAFTAAFPHSGPGKLVLILGLELDALPLVDTIDLIENQGVRSVIPIHLVNNDWGGTAVYGDLFNTLNEWQEGSYFELVNDTSLSFELGEAQHLNASFEVLAAACAIQPQAETETDPGFAYTELRCSGDPTGGQRNARGISDWYALFALMQKGILLDMSHMGWASKSDTLGYAEAVAGLSAWGGYPVIDSHTSLRDESEAPTRVPEVTERDLTWLHAKRIQQLGGVIGFGTVGTPQQFRIVSAPGKDKAIHVRLTGEGREFTSYLQATDERTDTDVIHELRVRLRTGADNLENDSKAQLLIDALGTVHEFDLKDAGAGEWENESINAVTLTQTAAGTPLSTLALRVMDVDAVGVRLDGSDDWNIDRLDVLYSGVESGSGLPTGGLLVERFGTPYARLSGPLGEILTPPVDWRPRILADEDVLIQSIQFQWFTDKTGTLDPDHVIVLHKYPETLLPGEPATRTLPLSSLLGLTGDPDGGGNASGTWDLLADPVFPSTIRYGDIAGLTIFATGENSITGYSVRVKDINIGYTVAGGSPTGVFVDGTDATAMGQEPFWIRDDRQTAQVWRGLPPPSPTPGVTRALMLAEPLRHLRIELATGGDSLRAEQEAFLDLELRDGRIASMSLASAGIERSGDETKELYRHLPFDDVLVDDVVSARVRVPGFKGGIPGDNWDLRALQIFRAGDPVEKWLADYGEANWVMAGDPAHPPDPAMPPDPGNPADPTRYGQGFVAIGTDFNGFSPQMPYVELDDPGSEPVVGAPIPLPPPYDGAVLSGDATLGRSFSVEDDGLAHYAMLADLAGKMQTRDPWAADSLYQSAVRTLEAWKQADRVGATLAGLPAPLGVSTGACTLPACSDGVDNDGDGLTDFPSDLDCADASGATEVPEPSVLLGLFAGCLWILIFGPSRNH